MTDEGRSTYTVAKILFPTDFSVGCLDILDHAVSLARPLGSDVDILHVWKPGQEMSCPPALVVPGELSPEAAGFPRQELIADMRTLLCHVPRDLRGRVRGHVKVGGVRSTILQDAEACDLVTMGTLGRSSISHVLLGSVAETVVTRAPCPVLTHKPRVRTVFPRAIRMTLRDSTPVLLRPIVPEDKALLQEGLARMSPESRYRRFMSPIRELSEKQIFYLTEIDHVDHMAWGAVDMAGSDATPLGSARYMRIKGEPTVAEAAIAVVDSYQGRGLGSLLLAALSRSAAANGIKTFRAYVLQENLPIQRMLESLNADLAPDCEGCMRFEVAVPDDVDNMPNTPMGRVFKAVARRMMPPPAVDFLHAGTLRKVVEVFSRLIE